MQPTDAGGCDKWAVKYYYEPSVGRCQQFYYGGCGGNDNIFATEEECEKRCSSSATIGSHVTGGLPHRQTPAYDPHRETPAYDPHRETPVYDPHRETPAYDPHRETPVYDPLAGEASQYQDLSNYI